MDKSIARYIDHAVLKPELTRAASIDAIRSGVESFVRTVCVRPCDIALAVDLCKGSKTDVCCVMAFPHGCIPYEVKAFEASNYIGKGIQELDMVANYGFIKSGMWDEVEREIEAVSTLTKKAGVIFKVIFETCTLTQDEIYKTTEIAVAAGADFIKTSTGFHEGGATFETVKMMLDAAKGRIKVKASGGIRDLATARKYVEMGCERLGVGYTTTPVLIKGEGQSTSAY